MKGQLILNYLSLKNSKILQFYEFLVVTVTVHGMLGQAGSKTAQLWLGISSITMTLVLCHSTT